MPSPSSSSPDYLEDVIPMTLGLLNYLERSLTPFMEHFFLKDVNILRNIDSPYGTEAADTLQSNITDGINTLLPGSSEVEKVISILKGMKGMPKDDFDQDILDNERIRKSIEKINKTIDILEKGNHYTVVEFNDGTCLKRGALKCTNTDPSIVVQ